MRTFTKIALRSVLILIGVFLLFIVIVRSTFIVWRMENDTMWPLVTSNDVVVATKWFHVTSLHAGDLVIVDLPMPIGPTPTVRKIEQQTNTPAGQFYLRAVNTNGVDSQWLGALPARDIEGKVVWIIK